MRGRPFFKAQTASSNAGFFPPGGDWPFSLLAYSRPAAQRGTDSSARSQEALSGPGRLWLTPLLSPAHQPSWEQGRFFWLPQKVITLSRELFPRAPDTPGTDPLLQTRAGKLRVVWPPTAPGIRRCQWKSSQAGALKPGRAPFLSPGTKRL